MNAGEPPFEVAFSGDFFDRGGRFAYPDFDISALVENPAIALRFLPPREVIEPADLAGVDALVIDDPLITRASLPDDGRLVLVARFGVGFDSVDVAALSERSIALVNTPDGVRRPVATSIVALILAVTLRLVEKDRLARRGRAGFAVRGAYFGTGLVGKTLGSIGIGNIGAEMFRLLQPFGLRFLAHDPFATPETARSLGVEMVDFDTLLRRSDIVAINCPLTPETEGLVDARAIGLMKPAAILINTARGRIVDQPALTAALAEGRLAGAGLDVFAEEPPDDDDPLLRLDNVVLSPHALCWTNELIAGNGAADVRAVLDVMHGHAPASVVNKTVLSDRRWLAKLDALAARFGAAAERRRDAVKA